MTELCPCGSGLEYSVCCEPLIHSDRHATTPGELMRSRYAAYVKQHADYLIATWHPDCQAEHSRDSIIQSFQNTEWLGLTVIEEKTGNNVDEGYVEFIARFTDGSQEPHAIHERSRFLHLGQRWYYIDGIRPKPGRNATCPCGSGKKHKKCCGR
ncbi:YchJ family protein [Chania multitudinisentens]|uniref:YchJ family protein n=1 Tax=Chania multitudinisentens TaxID=1639108 RepID=UPI0004B54489|nr:YchJ family protein [Chania multitudinisentens]